LLTTGVSILLWYVKDQIVRMLKCPYFYF
jgi:hypothetical protein